MQTLYVADVTALTYRRSRHRSIQCQFLRWQPPAWMQSTLKWKSSPCLLKCANRMEGERISCTAQWGVRSATHAPRRVHVIEYDDSSTKGERMIYMLKNVRSDSPIEIVTTTAQRRMEEYFFFSFSLLNNVAIHAHKHTSTRLGRQGKVGYRLGTRP